MTEVKWGDVANSAYAPHWWIVSGYVTLEELRFMLKLSEKAHVFGILNSFYNMQANSGVPVAQT